MSRCLPCPLGECSFGRFRKQQCVNITRVTGAQRHLISLHSIYIYIYIYIQMNACFPIAQALRVALLRAPPNTFFEDTFMWSGEDTFPAAKFPSATELAREDAFRRHFSRSRISPRHRITSRRRFSKTLFPQPNFSPPPNYLAKTPFEDTFPAAEFTPATELKKNNTARATDQRYCTVLEGDDQQKKEVGEGCVFVEVLCS